MQAFRLALTRLPVIAVLLRLTWAADVAQPSLTPAKVEVGAFTAFLFVPPQQSSAPRPVVLFVGGAGGIECATTYSELLTKVAAQGFIVVGLDRERMIDYPRAGEQFLDVLRWARSEDGLKLALIRSFGRGSGISPDTAKLAIMGQSSGNHILGEALLRSCGGVQAWVMIDPVDGFDPFRIVKSEDLITPGQKLNFTLPSLLLNNGLDPAKDAIPGFPPCAPPELSNDRFFDAMRGPIWAINATAYGHTDCMDKQPFLCPTNRSTDKDAYRSMLAQASATFLDTLFGRQPRSHFARLEEAAGFNVSVVLKRDLKGLEHAEIRPGCASATSASQRHDGSGDGGLASATLVV